MRCCITGTHKPDTTMFKKAIDISDVSPDEVLHVGDSYINDYLPAQSLGIKPLLFCSTSNTLQHPDCTTITEINQLLDHV